MTDINYKALTEDQLCEIVAQAQHELGRRQTEAAFAQQVADLYKDARDSGAITPPAAKNGSHW